VVRQGCGGEWFISDDDGNFLGCKQLHVTDTGIGEQPPTLSASQTLNGCSTITDD
jgi:hypothetical protein